MVLVPRDRNSSQDLVCVATVQPSGHSFSPNERAAKVAHPPRFLPDTGFTVRPSRSGSLRVQDQCQSQAVRLLEAESPSACTGCTQPLLEQQRQALHLSSVESNPVDLSEAAGGAGTSNNYHPILAERDLVP